MSKQPTHRTVSRMSGLRILIACLLTAIARAGAEADEPAVHSKRVTETKVAPSQQPTPATPSAVSEASSIRPRQRKQLELKTLHDEVRSLREDVRRLSDLLEKRLAAKSLPHAVPALPPAVSDLDRRGKLQPIAESDVLLYFTAKWCGPCQQMQPLVDKLVREGRAIKTIDVDQAPEMANEHRITSIPCFIRLVGGKGRERVCGVISEKQLRMVADSPKGVEQQLQRALDQKIAVTFNHTPLQDAVQTIAKQIEANFVVDQVSLAEEGVKGTEPVTLQLSGLTARSVLKLLLEPVRLDYVIENEVIKVVSRQRAKGELIVACYVVSDLLSVDSESKTKADAERIELGLKRILEIVQSTIAPDSWDHVGGVGSIRSYSTTCSLIVRQSRDVHEEILNLLDAFRKLKDVSKPGIKEKQAVPASAKEMGSRSNPESVDQTLIIKTYAVADLVIPLPSDGTPLTKPRDADWLKLIDLITQQCDSDDWPSRGGAGSIQSQEPTLSLVIRTKPATHEKIANVLRSLRREQDVQVMTEVRLFEVADVSELKQAGLELKLDTRTGSMMLDAETAKKLGEAYRGPTVFAPKMTMFNGQIGMVSVGNGLLKESPNPSDEKPFELHLRGVVASDRKSVCLGVALNPQSLVNELVRQSQTIPDGGSLLVDLTKELNPNPATQPARRKFALVQTHVIIHEEEVGLGELNKD